MKWFSIIPFLALSVLSLLFNACEKHSASQLPPEGATAFGEHAWPSPGNSSDAKPAGESAAPAKPEAATPAAEAKPGEAPKFFPDNK